jgi:hypothetical protein
MQNHLFTKETGADLTPPQVVSTNPPSGATGVGTNVVLQATFDRPRNEFFDPTRQPVRQGSRDLTEIDFFLAQVFPSP